VKVNTRLGARPFVTLARLEWADALRTRAARSDYGQARVLARQAAIEARRLEMPGPLTAPNISPTSLSRPSKLVIR